MEVDAQGEACCECIGALAVVILAGCGGSPERKYWELASLKHTS
jgi:hypothetical protein